MELDKLFLKYIWKQRAENRHGAGGENQGRRLELPDTWTDYDPKDRPNRTEQKAQR